MSNKEVLRAFLHEMIQGVDIKDDQDIFSTGLVNSLFAMQLLSFIEKSFDIEVDDEDLELDNFCSVNAVDAFIGKKRSLSGVA